MRVGSLFTGIGGFDLGLERAGHEIVWQVEIDKQARSVLRRHWPNVELYEDVRQVGGTHIGGSRSSDRSIPRGDDAARSNRTSLASVDLICGGFPCQDVSVAGKRAGLAGERSGLWWEFHRIIGELAPTWCLIENVPGLLSSNGGEDMACILRGLEELGYGWSYRILDSQYFGVAQRRRRVFIVGRGGGFCPPEILLEPESVFGDSAPSRETREGDTRGVARCLRGQSQASHREDSDTYVADTDTLVAFDWQQDGAASEEVSTLCTTRTQAVYRKATKQPDYDRWEETDKSGTLVGHDLGSDVRTSEVTLTATMPRRLTPTECERLQGFPDGWTTLRYDELFQDIQLVDSPRYRMMGNAVTVNVAEWIGHRFTSTDSPE